LYSIEEDFLLEEDSFEKEEEAEEEEGIFFNIKEDFFDLLSLSNLQTTFKSHIFPPYISSPTYPHCLGN